jgi:hypothetical protein
LVRRNWFIRTFTAGLLPVAGMATMGYFSDWEIGIDVIALSLGYLSWADLTHLVLGITASWAALWAWHRPARRGAVTPAPREHALPPPPPRRSRGGASGSRSFAPRLRVVPRASAGPGASSRLSPGRVRAKLGGRTPTRPRRLGSFRLHRPHVQLALVEEHRCPYCLEPVLRTDARGVKECEICHTLHHADCWAITGTCQVPHENS